MRSLTYANENQTDNGAEDGEDAFCRLKKKTAEKDGVFLKMEELFVTW